MSIHKTAFLIATALFVFFCSVVALYARWGPVFVVDLYENHQIMLAEDRTGRSKLLHYEDLLRVKPDSIHGRGLLVSALLETNETLRALVVARAGVERTADGNEFAAQLILARAQLASGRLEEVSELHDAIEAKFPLSGEAAYQKAHLLILRGELEEAWNAYDQLREIGVMNSTKEFAAHYLKALALLRDGQSTGDEKAAHDLVTRARHLEATGDIEKALDAFELAYQLGDRTPDTFFWLGVDAERQGAIELALDRYLEAYTAPRRHAYARIAYARLRGKSS